MRTDVFLNINNVIKTDPVVLVKYLSNNYYYEIPASIESSDEFGKVGRLLSDITNAFSYLMSLEANLSIYVKLLKLNCPNKPSNRCSDDEKEDYRTRKEEYEMMMLRKNAITSYIDILKQQYNCLSRMITVKLEANKELNMGCNR